MSADTSISCTQPTRPFCKPLTHNKLQKPGVGRHHTNLHSADIHLITQQTKTTHISIHSYTHIPIYPYTHTPQTANKHQTPTPPNTYTANKFTVSPTKTIQRLLYLQRCGHRFIQQGPTTRTNNKDQQQGPTTRADNKDQQQGPTTRADNNKAPHSHP